MSNSGPGDCRELDYGSDSGAAQWLSATEEEAGVSTMYKQIESIETRDR